MAQGNKKNKNNSKPQQKQKNNNAKNKALSVLKKGKYVFKAKKEQHVEVQKFKKNVQKTINTHIESEYIAKASKLEEGKPFYAINRDVAKAKSSK
jgi:hypothetical protein